MPVRGVLVLCVGLAAASPLGRTVTLRGGAVMPSIGLGSSGACHPDIDGSEHACPGYAAVRSALSLGYRSFHDALSYSNQAGLGAAISDAVAASEVSRAEIFMMSMVPKYLMGYNETIAAVEASLGQLNVSYLDLVMIHHRAADAGEWPRVVSSMVAFPDNLLYSDNPLNNRTTGMASWLPPPCAVQDSSWVTCQDESWRALSELKARGKVRAIGVSNWLVRNLERMSKLGMELPAVNQIESHIGWWDQAMLDWCEAHGVLVQAATPLSRSLPALITPGVQHDITAIATKYSKSPAQVALRFLLDKGISPIPSSHSAKYQAENLDIFDFSLSAEELVTLGKIAIPCRGSPADGLMKCWADPSSMMCTNHTTGAMFHCP